MLKGIVISDKMDKTVVVKVEEYKNGLNFVAATEQERVRWEAAKKQEAQKIISHFSAGEGKAQVLKLNKEDGR